jgi:hypothetical protein
MTCKRFFNTTEAIMDAEVAMKIIKKEPPDERSRKFCLNDKKA